MASPIVPDPLVPQPINGEPKPDVIPEEAQPSEKPSVDEVRQDISQTGQEADEAAADPAVAAGQEAAEDPTQAAGQDASQPVQDPMDPNQVLMVEVDNITHKAYETTAEVKVSQGLFTKARWGEWLVEKDGS